MCFSASALDLKEGCSVLIESLITLFAWLDSNCKNIYCYKMEHIMLCGLMKGLGIDEPRRLEALLLGLD